MKGIRLLAAAAAAVICLGSCVSNKKYNKLQMEYQTTRDGLLRMQFTPEDGYMIRISVPRTTISETTSSR